MPAKSRRERKKHPVQSQKGKGRPGHSELSIPPTAGASGGEPVVRSRMPAPEVRVPAPVAKPAAVLHPYITRELLNIGILAIVMVAILVVLALVLPS